MRHRVEGSQAIAQSRWKWQRMEQPVNASRPCWNERRWMMGDMPRDTPDRAPPGEACLKGRNRGPRRALNANRLVARGSFKVQDG